MCTGIARFSCAPATAISRAGSTSLGAMARPLRRLLDPFRARGPHVTAVLLTGLVAATVGVIGQLSHLLPGVESDTVALRFQARESHRPSDLVVVGIDDGTFSDLDQQWPFPRRLHAQAIDRLRRAGARTIAYDVQFTEPTDARNDLALFAAVKRAGNVVLATTETDARARTNVLGGRRTPETSARGRGLVLAARRTCARRTPSRARATSRPARAGSSSASPARRWEYRRSPTRPRGARAGRRSPPRTSRRMAPGSTTAAGRARSARSRSPTWSGAGSTRRSSAARSSPGARLRRRSRTCTRPRPRATTSCPARRSRRTRSGRRRARSRCAARRS